jgi:hypothetical protein
MVAYFGAEMLRLVLLVVLVAPTQESLDAVHGGRKWLSRSSHEGAMSS